MKVIDVEGRSIEDAKRKALELYNIDVTKLTDDEVEVLDEGKSGIFGIGISRSAKIRITYNDSEEDIGEKVKEILLTIIDKMGLEVKIRDFHESEFKVYVDLESPASGILIGKKGATLESLQLIVNMIIANTIETEKKVIIDIETYRAKREKALRILSKNIAAKVARSGKPWTLEPMNPFERRLIHMSLQNDRRVETRSEGEGQNRKVKIMPKYE